MGLDAFIKAKQTELTSNFYPFVCKLTFLC